MILLEIEFFGENERKKTSVKLLNKPIIAYHIIFVVRHLRNIFCEWQIINRTIGAIHHATKAFRWNKAQQNWVRDTVLEAVNVSTNLIDLHLVVRANFLDFLHISL